jgi:hypothetical protein
MTTNVIARNASVAMQQKTAQTVGKHSALPTDQLHQEMLKARDTFLQKCVGAESYAVDVLLPYCEEIIERYKMQGVAAKNRPNGKPTVESYFKSIKLNYSTVRSWIHRKKLQTEMFRPKMLESGNSRSRSETTPCLTQLEARLLARIIHIFEDNKGLLCYKHVVKTMFAATKEASECLKITQHSVCCSQRFFASLS